MVEFEEIVEETPPASSTPATATTTVTVTSDEPLMSAERKLDAQEIQTLASSSTLRPTVKAHLTTLADKLFRDASALERMEASKAKTAAAAAATTTTSGAAPQDATPASDATATESTPPTPTEAAPTPVVRQVEVNPSPPPKPSNTSKYTPISRFSFDAGSSSDPFVTIYIPLPNVGTIPKSNIDCVFTNASFDLTITELEGKNYRLVKDNLDKDIVGDDSKLKIRSNKIILKLAKVKSEYGSYDFWTDLTSKKSKKEAEKKKSADPSAGIMDLMKDMYDSGDDNMKKTIAEAMMKSRNGETDSMKPGGMGGMGGMGGLDGMDDLGM